MDLPTVVEKDVLTLSPDVNAYESLRQMCHMNEYCPTGFRQNPCRLKVNAWSSFFYGNGGHRLIYVEHTIRFIWSLFLVNIKEFRLCW